MSVVEEYLTAYQRQFDYWEGAATRARLMIEAGLNSSGLRAIATSRAKSVDRLAEKLEQRSSEKKYRSASQISKDIVDLAGVRVALYFPGQMEEVDQLVRSLFIVEGEKQFPAESKRRIQSRFSGYGARHFRVRIPEDALPAQESRYGGALIEVQVASVLMHAWSEVEHDLVYKPLEGELSSSEYALLDQLNGLVLAGEIALEQLQLAADQRVTAAETPFRDHYELAEYLRSQRSTLGRQLTDAALGGVDILFDFLSELQLARARDIAPYLEQLDHNFEERPVAEQLSDLMLSGDPNRYDSYRRATSSARHKTARRQSTQTPGPDAQAVAFERFIRSWAELEHVLRLVEPNARPRPVIVNLREALKRELIDEATFGELRQLQNLRNQLVHAPLVSHGGGAQGPTGRLTWAIDYLSQVTDELKRQLPLRE